MEIVSQTYLANYGSRDLAAVLYLVAGIGVGVFPLLIQPKMVAGWHTSKLPKVVTWLILGLLLLGIFYFGHLAIKARPLDYTFADMLPIIQIMGERWLGGEEVYAIIPEIWDGMQPIYLPVMWLSYIPAVLLEVDIRVVNLAMLALASTLVMEPWQDSGRRAIVLKLGLLIPMLGYVLYFYSTFITISEEPVVVSCYALLGYAVLRDKRMLFAVALMSCLLSRYTLIFWAVAYLGYWFWQRDRRQAIQIALVAGALGLLILVFSQGIYQLELFLSLKEGYLDSFQDPDLAWRTKNAVAKNIGVARFLAFDQLIYLHRTLFWVSLILPFLLFAWYHLRLRKKGVPVTIFAICSLKLCLVYFFNFNAIPYSYLFYTSTFLSIVLFSQLVSANSVEHDQLR